MSSPDVKVGQQWMDCDKRCAGRIVRVIAVWEDWAVVAQPRARPVAIALKRMYPHSTGFRLLADRDKEPK